MIEKQGFVSDKQILINQDSATRIGCLVSKSGVLADGGKYIVKAGTPLYGTDVGSNRDTALTVTESGHTAQGILYSDVVFDDSQEAADGTIVISGTVDTSLVDYEVCALYTPELKNKLKKIRFICGGRRVPSQVADRVHFATALKVGGDIVLENDITDIDGQIDIVKDTIIDLNGKKLEGSSGAKPALLFVTDGSKLVIKGEGTVNCKDGYAVYVGGAAGDNKKGTAIIEEGNFNASTTVVHVMRGNAEIKGGTFKLNNDGSSWGTNYLLNCQDTSVGFASIVVTGGTFYKFDPSAADNHDIGVGKTNYVKAGYKSVKDVSQNSWTVIQA